MNRLERYQAERNCGRTVPLPCVVIDSGHDSTRWLVSMGACGCTHLLVIGGYCEEAIEEAIGWAADNAPGLLADEQVREEYERLIGEGKTEEEAWEESEVDTISGDGGHHINSWETNLIENPGRERLLDCFSSRDGWWRPES